MNVRKHMTRETIHHLLSLDKLAGFFFSKHLPLISDDRRKIYNFTRDTENFRTILIVRDQLMQKVTKKNFRGHTCLLIFMGYKHAIICE